MKTSSLVLFSVVLVFITHTGFAQLINPGFETWSSDAVGILDPNSGNATTGWGGLQCF